jgi:hypothetical protein
VKLFFYLFFFFYLQNFECFHCHVSLLQFTVKILFKKNEQWNFGNFQVVQKYIKQNREIERNVVGIFLSFNHFEIHWTTTNCRRAYYWIYKHYFICHMKDFLTRNSLSQKKTSNQLTITWLFIDFSIFIEPDQTCAFANNKECTISICKTDHDSMDEFFVLFSICIREIHLYCHSTYNIQYSSPL